MIRTPPSATLTTFLSGLAKVARYAAGGIVALGLVVGIGQLAQRADRPADYPQVFDSARRILFDAKPGSGAVRAFGLRSGITDLVVLKAPGRHVVRDLRLDPSRRWLWVLGDDAVYRYDVYSMTEDGRFDLPEGEATKFSSVSRITFALEPVVVNAALEPEARRVR